MKRISPLLFGLLMIGLVSCNKNDGIDPGEGKSLVLTAAEQQKVAADNAFTLKLFKEISASEGTNNNLFMSPLSVSFAVGMTANGARNETLDAINSTMNYTGFTQPAVNSYYNKLMTELPGLEPNTQLKIANSIWYRQGLEVLQPFIDVNTSSYQAKVQALDFASPAAQNTINSWVSDKTNGKIPSIVDAISSESQMFLINAIYFKSIWKTKFDAAETKKRTFNLPGSGTVQADFMAGKINYNNNIITEGGKTTIIAEFPYAHDRFSMVAILPDASVSAKELIASINTDKWNTWMAGLGAQKSQVYLPKFKFSYGKSLKDPLINLGMGNAFSDMADFTGIRAAGGLTITDVKHKAFVDVNEQGTEAAAVTSVEIGTTSAGPIPVLEFNRPFIFVIREMKTGLVLFAGVVNNPLLGGE
ncbi:serpin family protein [Mucilaginibacter psychrotolerans]|uniref:Serpin family protein n=1 Tax=Mucilaginibacter psychrotolerans TaxID=1524096 RepID=A0A4Y8S4Z1_9SPHI|nr:serpin family protein [Mucilaginibacter psychrotolerans]TFF33796.1 serpin family protein [Mucilaginibacter psychrotolerans]